MFEAMKCNGWGVENPQPDKNLIVTKRNLALLYPDRNKENKF